MVMPEAGGIKPGFDAMHISFDALDNLLRRSASCHPSGEAALPRGRASRFAA
jgi:hypothetical protein